MVIVSKNIEISPFPEGLELEYFEIFSTEAIQFVAELVEEFQNRVFKILRNRTIRKFTLENENKIPFFLTPFNANEVSRQELFEDVKGIPGAYHEEWKISPLPDSLQNRHLDLGDISPSDSMLVKSALLSGAQGIQLDFDDGHCPTWSNMIKGIHNLISIVNGKFFPLEVPPIEKCPILIPRPRAWNMNEHNFMVNGKEIPGPLMDFGLLVFHIGSKTAEKGLGPFFYLPKVESAKEARLWDDIFIWAENKLSLIPGTIKACVLIENILAAYEVEQILFELRHHSFGLNCGVWDYAASIVNKFGSRRDFILPDRSKYVSMDQPFMNKYMKLVVKTCHKHGAPATGGMIPFILTTIPEHESDKREALIQKILLAKKKEIETGVDGFLAYDTSLIPILKDLWTKCNGMMTINLGDFKVSEKELLDIPPGGVTLSALEKNIKVVLLFIYSWLEEGKGLFILEGAVEDSATAEISRSQIWQWIYHQVQLEGDINEVITKSLVTRMSRDICDQFINQKGQTSQDNLLNSCEILLDLASSYEFPEFITTYLYNNALFRKLHKS